IHDLRNNPWGYTFDPDAAPLLSARSQLQYNSVHLHANGDNTAAHLEVAFVFHPKGYKPKKRIATLSYGTGDIDILPMKADQESHVYGTLSQNVKLLQFGPHMHAAGVRMCLQATFAGRTETLNCAGYDHNWLQYYRYADDVMPLLPKGTVLHATAYFDNTPA